MFLLLSMHLFLMEFHPKETLLPIHENDAKI
jgi:hypothetical protein